MSQYQRDDWKRPIHVEIDLNQDVERAFQNCINSFQGLETESMMQGGVSMMQSKISFERFTSHLGVLDGLIGEKTDVNGDWNGGEFKPEMAKAEAFKYWAALVRYLKNVGFFKHIRKESTL